MDLVRDGRLTNSDIETGDRLLLELYGQDIFDLSDTEGLRRIGVRMCQLRRGRLRGWDSMDKAQVSFYDGDRAQATGVPISLRLDPGGDLYFSVFDNSELRGVDQLGVHEIDEKDVLDPNDVLSQRGISRVAVIGLGFFRQVLDDPFFRRQV